MAFVPTTPITGSAQTGLTTPTYTISADTAPDVNGKQFYVSALGGTQTGVNAHSVASPFTVSMFKPKVLKTLGPVNAATGQLRSVPVNVYKVIVRKGVLPLAGQPYKTAHVTAEIAVPAGSDLAGAIELRAMLSCFIGLVTQISNEIGNSVTTGTI
jgi:hypothetical protein